eukprot:Filipodium_phascolosomae@DN1705_c0_g1_i1.p1
MTLTFLPSPLDWICIGDKEASKNISILQTNNVKYILNCTPSRRDGGLPNYHEKAGHFEYCRLPMHDNATETLQLHYEKAWDFLERCRIREDGNCFAHCNLGVSRSVSMVSSYLVKYHKLSLPAALELIVSQRPQACPNNSFQTQLKTLEVQLQGEGHWDTMVTFSSRTAYPSTPAKKVTEDTLPPRPERCIGAAMPPWMVKKDGTENSIVASVPVGPLPKEVVYDSASLQAKDSYGTKRNYDQHNWEHDRIDLAKGVVSCAQCSDEDPSRKKRKETTVTNS